MTTFLLILIAIIAYLLGAVNGAIIASKYIFRRDIRNYGSHNAGLTNFYRVFGVPGTALVLVIDVLKTVFAVLIGGWLLGIVKEPMVGRLFAGFCAILGHCYPVYYGFKGGKGVLCGAVVALFASPGVGVVCIVVFVILLILTRYVSLASIVSAALLPLGIWIGLGKGHGLEGVIGLFCFLLIAFQHRKNISRLLKHEEPKFSFKVPPRGFGE